MFDAQPPFVEAAELHDKVMRFVANVLFGLLIIGVAGAVAFVVYVAVATSHPHPTQHDASPATPAATMPQ